MIYRTEEVGIREYKNISFLNLTNPISTPLVVYSEYWT